jgi:rod shape-determining protein MreC
MFAVFVILAVVLLFLPNAYRENLARGVRATLLRPVLALQQGAIERHSAFEDPSRLRAQRDSLAAFLVGQATLSAENRHLRELLGIRERLPPSFVPAEVVRIPGRGSEGFFQLTAGTEHGLAAGSPIVSAEGLVGRVREADGRVSFGIDWMHPEFRASAMTVEGDVYGIVEPRRVGGEALLALTGTPRHVELETDALIVTSGHGGVFPRGIPIGVVIGPEGGEEGWQRNYLVRPLVAPTEMTYVLVLGEPQRSLEGQDLALSWGIRPVEPIPEVERDFEAAVAAADAAAARQPVTPAAPAQPAQPQPSPPGLLGEPVEP